VSGFKSYRDLEVWQRSMEVARQVYDATCNFPNEEKFGLTSQMRRAAVSVPSNIAEGHARSGTGEFLQFLSISLGSVAELETQILLSVSLKYLDQEKANVLLEQLGTIGRMLRGLQRTLNQRRNI
jgi:four helix bundle protein